MKKYKYSILTIFLLFLLFLSSSFGYYFDYIKVNENIPVKTVTFKINKADNYSYKLSFVHYGNINKDMKINLYLNGNLIYTIDDSNDASPAYKKNVTIDITNYLKDGKNILKVEAVNLIGNENYHPYYVLKDVYINEPQTKTPISFGLMVITLLIMSFLIYKRGIS